MKSNTIIRAAVAAVFLASSWANAGLVEDEIVRNVTPLLNNMPVEKVVQSQHAGLYEILTPRGLFYTDKVGSFVIFNAVLVDSKTKVNLTDRRVDELINFNFSDFPLKDAIKTVKGDGSRIMVTFEDPNCGYCKKLSGEIDKLDNVTVYTFLMPILSPDSTAKAKAVWCSADRSKAWTDLMSKNVMPVQVTSSCDTPIERNLALGRRLHVAGTPAIYYKSAPKERGFVKAEQIEAKLK